MKKNVKVIASLVRKARKKLQQDKRDEALELMRKAVSIDDNNGVLVQVIQVIGRKRSATEPEQEPVEAPEEAPVVEHTEQEPVEDLDEAWVVEQTEQLPAPEEQEPVEDLDEAWFIEQTEQLQASEVKTVEKSMERIASMVSEDQLKTLFKASDMEYDNGNQQKAIAYLKRATKLDPDNPEVQFKIDLLKTKIKSANLVQIARKKLASGEAVRAVVLAREAFNLKPDTAGLDELLNNLENSPDISSSTDTVKDSGGAQSVESGEYIARIRQLVQDNSLEEAASVAEKAFNIFPDDGLIVEFVDNFKKLGLLE